MSKKKKKLGREEIVFNSTICLFLSKVKYSRGSRVTGPFQDFPPRVQDQNVIDSHKFYTLSVDAEGECLVMP